MTEQKQEKGSITVFLSLVLLVLLSLVAQIMQEAMFQADRIKLSSAMEVSLNAVLGEYCKEVLEDYGVFFLDASEENGVFGIEHVASRLDYYMYKNVQEQSGMLQMQLCDTQISHYTLATDNDGAVFVQEAVKAYQEKIAAKTIEQAFEKSKKYKEAETARETVENNQVEASELAIPKDVEVDLEEKKEAEKITNPVEVIEALKANSLLGIVGWDLNFSDNAMDLNNTLQHRKLNQGNYKKEQKTSVTDQMIFDLYLKDQFFNFRNCKSKEDSSCLQYEIEYLISGKAGDKENLAGVLEKIIWIREGINFVYLLNDSVKMAEADALATALVGYTGIAPLVVAMKYAILAVWAYGESLLEARILLTGGKVDFAKTNANWKLQLSSLANVATILKGESKGDERGMTYEEYLGVLLSAVTQKNKSYRSMDLIEKQIQSSTNVTSFRMDCCLSYIEGEVSALSRCGRELLVCKAIGY